MTDRTACGSLLFMIRQRLPVLAVLVPLLLAPPVLAQDTPAPLEAPTATRPDDGAPEGAAAPEPEAPAPSEASAAWARHHELELSLAAPRPRPEAGAYTLEYLGGTLLGGAGLVGGVALGAQLQRCTGDWFCLSPHSVVLGTLGFVVGSAVGVWWASLRYAPSGRFWWSVIGSALGLAGGIVFGIVLGPVLVLGNVGSLILAAVLFSAPAIGAIVATNAALEPPDAPGRCEARASAPLAAIRF